VEGIEGVIKQVDGRVTTISSLVDCGAPYIVYYFISI